MSSQQRKVPWIIWSALLIAQLLLALVALLKDGRPLDQTDVRAAIAAVDQGGPTAILFAAGIMLAVASAIVPSYFARLQPSSRPAAARAFVPFIVGLALAEACTMMGFVATTLPPPAPDRVLLPAALGMLTTLVVHRPTDARMKRLAGD